MAKKYVPEGAFTACNKGTSPSTLRVSNNKNTTIYSVPMATELDFLPFFNLKPMGFCSSPMKWMTGITCLPTVIGWQQPKEGVKINGSRMLLEDSYCDCIFGGKINIFFDRAAAVSFGLGDGKMPSEYIKEGFDWLEQKNKESREARDSFLPDWMKPVTGVTDWMNDLGSGLVEGAVNGVVGLGETLYQVGQDPVGTAEALGGMIKEGYNATVDGVSNAYDWASKGENWSNAADGAWTWASDGQNWIDAGNATAQGLQDAGNWVAQNPRKIGTTVGEFVPDAVAAVYTAGGSTAVSAGRIALKEGAEEVVERAAREGLEEAGERATREAVEEGGEALATRTGRELIESLSDDAADIARVITRSADDIQDDLLRQVKNGEIELNTTARKGNFGEMATDRSLMNDGFEPLHQRVTDIDAATHQGIDGVYKHPGPPPRYVVVDAKYGQAGLNTLSDGTRQMSDPWIQDRLANTVSREEMRNITQSGYDRVVAKVDANGNIIYRKVDADGYIIRGNAGNWP
ncbi:DUF4280 domain-containing protein [Chryseobacterium sp. SSA4.19]|uniref:PAAR-like protein n=1 Tax=Chryseobacterium sp. SSA4.19 TaxID=2919915 RepID=UPI001F4D83CC|nr:PAAR-like protein [Chryseobacterium sp. SSA4.19]MCJ8155697.1 DUF4280 domain-containing protein [Chryseobacterium sp. SSA4.19]